MGWQSFKIKWIVWPNPIPICRRSISRMIISTFRESMTNLSAESPSFISQDSMIFSVQKDCQRQRDEDWIMKEPELISTPKAEGLVSRLGRRIGPAGGRVQKRRGQPRVRRVF